MWTKHCLRNNNKKTHIQILKTLCLENGPAAIQTMHYNKWPMVFKNTTVFVSIHACHIEVVCSSWGNQYTFCILLQCIGEIELRGNAITQGCQPCFHVGCLYVLIMSRTAFIYLQLDNHFKSPSLCVLVSPFYRNKSHFIHLPAVR